jgi:hypothetical protein
MITFTGFPFCIAPFRHSSIERQRVDEKWPPNDSELHARPRTQYQLAG